MDVKTALIMLAASVFGTLGFSFIFRTKKSHVLLTTIAGTLACTIYIVCCYFFKHEFFQNLFPALFAAAFAEVLARITKSTATAYSACTIVVLIPGAKLYYTMYYIIVGNIEAFRTAGIELLRIASGIAVGIVLVTVIVREFNRRRFDITNK